MSAETTATGWIDELTEAFGTVPDPGFGPPTVDVDAAGWLAAVTVARDVLSCEFFDFLTAVDELVEGFSLVVHVARRTVGHVDTVVIRTRVARESPSLSTISTVYPGARWHERETHEMFGIGFAGNDDLAPLLLPDGFEGHPLRKDFVLASRVAKSWPGAKEPGESEHDAAPSRRRTRPPGVPDPQEWGPLATPDSAGPDAGSGGG